MTGISGADDVADLTESLRLARRETKLVRGQQEVALETLQRVRRQRAALRVEVRWLADALAAQLSERYWRAEQGRRGLLSRAGRSEEAAMVAEVEASDLFDAGWYLRQHPEIAEEGLSPGLHYVRTGAAAGFDPGTSFDSARYLREQPAARDSGLPPLVHHLRHGQG